MSGGQDFTLQISIVSRTHWYVTRRIFPKSLHRCCDEPIYWLRGIFCLSASTTRNTLVTRMRVTTILLQLQSLFNDIYMGNAFSHNNDAFDANSSMLFLNFTCNYSIAAPQLCYDAAARPYVTSSGTAPWLSSHSVSSTQLATGCSQKHHHCFSS